MEDQTIYDAVGNKIIYIDFNGDTTRYQYDVNNNLTQKIFQD